MSLPALLASCATRPGAEPPAFAAAETRLGRRLPEDYRRILARSDGFEGFLGPNAFVWFWAAAQIAELNQGYAVSEFLPGAVLLGTDGGGMGFGFREQEDRVQYLEVPLVGMEPAAVQPMGATFEELLVRIARRPERLP